MDVYSQFVRPTAHSAAAAVRLVSPKAANLVLAAANTLRVYAITHPEPYLKLKPAMDQRRPRRSRRKRGEPEPEPKELEPKEEKQEDTWETISPDKPHRLELISEYVVNGHIESIHAHQTHFSSCEYLIVRTDAAKLSVVKWDHDLHQLANVSLHNYEHLLSSVTFDSKDKVQHTYDPQCDVLCVDDLLVFLPFKKAATTENDEASASSTSAVPKLKSILSTSKDPKKPKKSVQIITPDEELARNISIHSPQLNDKFKNAHFSQSFILNASTLNSQLKNIVNVQFLHGYSDPTLAILYAPETNSSSALLPRVMDNLNLMVLTINMETRTGQSIMHITSLPYDLHTIHSLQDPIQGLLIQGCNELVHVNSLGSIKSISVNSFAEKCSKISMINKSSLGLDLSEACIKSIKGKREVLLVANGKWYVILFDHMGNMSSIQEKVINNEVMNDLDVLDICDLADGFFFVVNNGSDGLLVGPYHETEANIKEVTEETPSALPPSLVNEDDDSWLYNEEEAVNTNVSAKTVSATTNASLLTTPFTIWDNLINIGPMQDFTLASLSLEPKIKQLPNINFQEESIIATMGKGLHSGVTILSPAIKPVLQDRLKLTQATKLWTLPDHTGNSRYLVSSAQLQTDVYDINESYRPITGGYDHGITVAMATMNTKFGLKIVQITKTKVIIFNMGWNVTTSFKIDSEEEINFAQIFDKFVLFITKVGSLKILFYNQQDRSLDLIDLPALLNFQIFTNGWISAGTVAGNQGSLGKKRNHDGEEVKVEKSTSTKEDLYSFWVVTADNRILTFNLNHLERVWETPLINNLPTHMSLKPMDPSYEADVDPFIKQCVFTSLGDRFHKQKYLLLLTFGGEIIIYQEYESNNEIKFVKINSMCGFPITGAPENSYKFATQIEKSIYPLVDLDGKCSLLISGRMPLLITKQSQSLPRMFKFGSKPMVSFAPMSTTNCKSGLVCIDDMMHVRSFTLDTKIDLTNLIPMNKVKLGITCDKIIYDKINNLFLVSTLETKNFKPVNEDDQVMGSWDENLKPQGTNFNSKLLLISPLNWSIIDQMPIENENSLITSLNVLPQMIICNTQPGTQQLYTTMQRQNKIFVGISTLRGEDIASTGKWMLLDIGKVNPDPAFPERQFKFKVTFQSGESRGPILSTCELSGRFATIQGQRLLVRTLKEDLTATPVAFTDTGLMGSKCKSIYNLVLTGDYYQGMELYGFDADPYRMIPLSKDEQSIPVKEFDVITYDHQMYILICQPNGKLNLMKYDPLDPKSVKGTKLIHNTTFDPNVSTVKMMGVSRRKGVFNMVHTLPFRKDFDLGQEIVGISKEGGVYRVTPVADYQHKKLHVIQNYINERIQWLGLGYDTDKGSIIDMSSISRFLNLDEQVKRKIAGKLGKTALVDIYRDVISVQ